MPPGGTYQQGYQPPYGPGPMYEQGGERQHAYGPQVVDQRTGQVAQNYFEYSTCERSSWRGLE